MKRSAILLVLCSVITWSACGGGGGNKSNTQPLSKVKDRVFVTNYFRGDIEIVDAAHDRVTGLTIGTNSAPTSMMLSPDGKITLVVDQSGVAITPIVNATEALPSAATANLVVGAPTESVALAADNKTGYAAVRNYNNGTGIALGAVQKFDYTTSTITQTIPLPAARWVAVNHAGTKLLVMSDLSDSVTIVDVTSTTPTMTTVTGFSRPVAAFFAADDSHAFVLNCGPECGGAQAGVAELLMSGSTIGRTVNLSSARIALLNGNTLYVAGSPNGSGGTAQTVDTSAFTASAPATIGLGQKYVMKYLANKIWIGSTNCGGTGCLTAWDPTSNNVTIDNPAAGQNSLGDVTGIALITSSSRMFVIEGGELRIYDTSMKPLTTAMDIVGQAWDVEYVPQ